ncbi:hypothetical protein H4R20_003966 [Coemansia guatemalensis]|uniref:histidine--tRNA ligase n=1 Tax=Coemansia guatemalensis TaxID=2761395 RepID=A0A9W8LS60_9FUNG|nr:hypothetical protein H4R20_003966 [Coemansia guatemalensis]
MELRNLSAAFSTAMRFAGQSSRRYSLQQTPRAVRGMVDRIGFASRKHQHIIDKARTAVEAFGFEPIQTPILEYSSVFERTLGNDSDVVGKELYKFLDSSEQWMTMRPEATASVARALITNNLDQNLPQKLYYAGPMFRHERPQKGRLRQFEQFGVEAVGIGHPAIDVECIQMGWQFLQSLNTRGELRLQLNTLGDSKSRLEYRTALRDYFGKHRDCLSADSQRRLDTNPLRIMDSKEKTDIDVSQLAPTYSDFLSAESRQHFDFVKRGLEALDIPFTLNSRLVRGLDYYQHTVWEVTCSSDRLGRSQATVLAGGRYDGLTTALGGTRSLPGVGWATGIERLALLLDDSEMPQQQPPIPVLAIPERSNKLGGGSLHKIRDDVYVYALQVAAQIRKHHSAYVVHGSGVSSDKPHAQQPLGKQMASILARKPMPLHMAIVGSAELESREVIVRDTGSRKQVAVDFDSIASHAIFCEGTHT